MMTQKRLQEGLTLIQKLLTCPDGEEWILLKQHEVLVDAEFVQLMEQVAAQLFREGDRQAAKYLHNWAAQLHHILIKEVAPVDTPSDHTQAYVDLIQALIDAPESDAAKVLAQHSELMGPGLVDTMHQVAKKMMAQGIYDQAQYLETLANQINQAWIQTHVWPQHNGAASRMSSTVTPPQDVSERPVSSAQSVATAPPLSQSPRRLEEKSEAADSHPHAQPPSAKGSGSESSLAETENTPTSPTVVPSPDPWGDTPLSSAMKLKVPQQIANGLTDVALLLHQIDKTLAAQTQVLQALATQVKTRPKGLANTSDPSPHNPLWYMDVLEKACDRAWVLTTDEIEDLLGVKPKCHADETTYERGCWQFEKSGKLGAQTAWRVHKVKE